MQCPQCNYANDPDALVCIQCERPMIGKQRGSARRQRKVYLSALVFIPVVLAVMAVGHYKLLLPDGVAAVVNGEEIKRSELDAYAARLERIQGEEKDHAGLRRKALERLIRERLMLQEAQRAGVRASDADVAEAIAKMKSSPVMNDADFSSDVTTQDSDAEAFTNAVRKRLTMDRFVSERVAPSMADPQARQAAIEKWFRRACAGAAVRVSLTEQWSGTGCRCCESRRSPGKDR